MTQSPREQFQLVRIYVGEQDKVDDHPLHEALVELALAQRMAGVTVLRGVVSYGASHHLHSARILRLSEDLPMVLEVVDAPAQMEKFMPLAQALLARSGGGLITLQPVEAIRVLGKQQA